MARSFMLCPQIPAFSAQSVFFPFFCPHTDCKTKLLSTSLTTRAMLLLMHTI